MSTVADTADTPSDRLRPDPSGRGGLNQRFTFDGKRQLYTESA